MMMLRVEAFTKGACLYGTRVTAFLKNVQNEYFKYAKQFSTHMQLCILRYYAMVTNSCTQSYYRNYSQPWVFALDVS